MKSTAIPVTRCVRCGYRMDETTSAYGEEEKPKAGDISICLCCGKVQAFEADLRLREATQEETANVWKQITEIQIVRAGMIGDKLRKRWKD